MNLYLVRHTRPDVPAGVCYGATDVDLPPDWPDEAAAVAGRLQRLDASQPKHVFSSPLQRCARLARRLFPDAPVVYDRRLREMDFGAWEMHPWSAVPRDRLDAWADRLLDFRPPGGENYRALQARCAAFVRDRLTGLDGDCCIVTHGGVIRALLALLEPDGETDETARLAALMKTPVEYGSVRLLAWPGNYGDSIRGVSSPV